MKQVAPFPTALKELVAKTHYKSGWRFMLDDIDRGQGSEGLTLTIQITVPDSYNPDALITVNHYMIVPPAAYDERAWARWLLDQVLLVEQHEACEFFMLGNERPYAPNHGPGRNPYSILERGTEEDAKTTYRGERF